MTVTDWPSYLLTNIPPDLRMALSAQAERDDTSVSDTIRAILCQHYSLECPPVSHGYQAGRDTHSPNRLLRVQPALFKAVKRDAKRQRHTMRHIILSILEEHDSRADQAA